MVIPMYDLKTALDSLKKNDFEGAISLAVGAAKQARFSTLSHIGSEKQAVIDMARYLDSAALYYRALSAQKLAEKDETAALAYLGASWGLIALVDTEIMPVVTRTPEGEHDRAVEFVHAELWNNITLAMSKTLSSIRNKNVTELQVELGRTVQKIVDAALSHNKQVRELAVALAQKFPSGDFKQARRLFEYVRDEVSYMRDPLGLEYIQLPETTLRLRSGDCEDKAVLVASMLISVGFEASLIFADSDHDGIADHVYAATYIPSAPDHCKPFPVRSLDDGRDLHNWVPLDPTYEDCEFGLIPIDDLEIVKFVFLSPAKSVVQS